jgi:hypothetical protein
LHREGVEHRKDGNIALVLRDVGFGATAGVGFAGDGKGDNRWWRGDLRKRRSEGRRRRFWSGVCR